MQTEQIEKPEENASSTLDVSSPVWLTGFWGFSPEEEGFLGFTDEKDRDRLFAQIDERQLIAIYGAASPETESKIVHHLLGILEIEREKIDAWDKISPNARQRNIELGRQDKWRFAMPARHAWRTKHTLDVKQIFPASYDPSNGRYIARFGTWLVPTEARWLLSKVPFTQVNVFGEPPVSPIVSSTDEASLERHLSPAAGIFGKFGERTVVTVDKPHALYLAHFPTAAELLTGKKLEQGKKLYKIGISGNLSNRLRALNLSFPETASLGWKIQFKANFPNRSSAADAETIFKKKAIEECGGISLGREFFIIDETKAESLFLGLSPATGLDLRAG
ncbi:GIY-YIG nuclease family protein [Ruegeria sp. HKCCD6428]|uniref:GIY-YIG nuclease family protein n=1 Tax=Ruegeria sp. HKCCD6428 TaxID=2683002 RepID=UPI001491C282|nr:GIY-YIG nuclease family protein [Ruegeria sp. HKCCD6428]NOC84533.1 GIY-YIG nuclease family protein [Ruegeria sp. HKCCD6428]